MSTELLRVYDKAGNERTAWSQMAVEEANNMGQNLARNINHLITAGSVSNVRWTFVYSVLNINDG